MISRILRFIACALSLVLAWPASADTYPSRPVMVVVPFPPGGSTDVLARILSKGLADELGKPFVVENRPGAGGTIGTNVVAHAAPDGYTLLVYHVSLATNASLYPNLPYDTLKDIAPVARVGSTPSLLVVPASSPIHSVGDLIATAKAAPGKINFASGGIGSALYLAATLFERTANVKFTDVPYRGGAPAVLALLRGEEVSFGIAVVPDVLQQIKAGKLRAIAVSSAHRFALMPDVPTIAESGLPGYEYATWYGVFATGGTPKPIIEKLNATVNRLLSKPEIKAQLKVHEIVPETGTPEAFAKFVRSEVAKWATILKGARVHAN
jgi:tripartite-type tricarboxylate transporter receptor subunit TctC